MNTKIEQLIKAAEEKGSITEQQRKIILSKAERLGEDLEEVEFYLGSIPLIGSQGTAKHDNISFKKKKCPNCGAVVSDMTMVCPECGHSFSNESEANENVSAILKECQEKIRSAGSGDSEKKNAIRMSAIRSLSVPYTNDALMRAFEFAYSLYESSNLGSNGNSYDHQYCTVCLAKAKELYRLVKSQPNPDQMTMNWIENHSFVENAKKKGDGAGGWCLVALLMWLAIGAGVFFLVRSCS